MNVHRTQPWAWLAGTLLLSSAGRGHAAAPDTAAAVARLDGLVAAERAFSAASVERGMKDAFLEYLADDGIIFAPGPVNGRKRWAARPTPKATLVWTPARAEASATGDLGVSLGPWELRPPAGSDGAVIHGHFISVWKRDGEAPWRVGVDLGVSHAAPAHGLDQVTFEPGPLHHLNKKAGKGGGLVVGGAVVGRRLGLGVGIGSYVAPGDRELRSAAHEANRMMSAERTYAFTMRGKGAEEALHQVAAPDVHCFRDGAMPAVGVVEAAELLAPQPQKVEWLPLGKGVAAARDLGFSYGLARRWPAGLSKPDTSAYLHVWRREPAGDWKLIVDVESPFPE